MRLPKIINILFHVDKTSTTDADVPMQLRHNLNILQSCAVLCSCGGLAIPTAIKGNRYRCVRCDKKYISAQYNLGPRNMEDDWIILRKEPSQIIDMTHYDEAVALLKNVKLL